MLLCIPIALAQIDAAQPLASVELAHLQEFMRVLTDADACHSAEASASLRHVLTTRFKPTEALAWRAQTKGSWRSVRAGVPCADTAQWWVPSGAWVAYPMWAHCCNKGPSVLRCPGRVVDPPSKCDATRNRALAGLCESDATLLCEPYLPSSVLSETPRVRTEAQRREHRRCESDTHAGRPARAACNASAQAGATEAMDTTDGASASAERPLVYSFGVAEVWTFEDWAGRRGFDVHAFDPTQRTRASHEAHDTPNVRFHYLGLGAEGGGPAAARAKLDFYGALGGEILALDGLMRRLGHEERSIRLLKIDCEGCEWEAFTDVAHRAPWVLKRVCTLVLEVHLTPRLLVNSTADLRRVSDFWELLMVRLGFRFWYVHANPGAALHYLTRLRGPAVHPLLRELGADGDTCCYEIGLHRDDC